MTYNLLETRVRDIKIWIRAPCWETAVDEARRHRAQDTGNWLLEHKAYLRWKCQWSPLQPGSGIVSKQILFISGQSLFDVIRI
jgi:hypothetical protein